MEEPTGSEEETTVRVAVRCRPFNSKEKANGETSCVKIYSDQVVLVNPANSGEEHSFAFDLVIDENATQESVWVNVGVPILNKAFNGFNGTIFAYGQTGSGKTWSMQGAEGEELQGIIPRMNNQLFERVESEVKKRPTVQFLITVSYFEIYNEVIFDLLDSSDRKKRSAAAKGGLEIKEHPVLGVYVKGLQEIVVDSAAKLQGIIDQGMRNRTVASTQMNADSSRSHSVFIINLHQKDVEDESKNVFAKVNLVDLAGSERVKSTGATGSTLKEGANINKSLSALGNVINALVEASKGKGAFIPYRNSKLTRVLQESLGGNSITAMLAALSPAACNFEETLSTLKYANRAKAIKVKAVKNEQSSQISKLNEEIRALKEKLMSQAQGGGGGQDGQDASALDEKNRQRLRDLEEAMRSTWEAKSKMSEEYERDRQALLIEQQNAARQFEAARQRNWALLEQKADLEITLSHVRTLVADRLGHTPVATLLGQWTEALREVVQLEKGLAEQATLVQVYRGSLEKDTQALVQQQCHGERGSATGATFNSTAFGMLRQLKEKVGVMSREQGVWMDLQDQLLQKVQRLLKLIKDAGSKRSILSQTAAALAASAASADNTSGGSSAALTKDEKKELHRGLSLIRKQVQQKQVHCCQTVAVSRTEFVSFESVRLDLVKLLSTFDAATAPEALLAATDATAADPAVQEILQGVATQAAAMRTKLELGAVRLVEVFANLEKAMNKALEMSRTRSTTTFAAQEALRSATASPLAESEEVVLEDVDLEGLAAEVLFNPRNQGTHHRSASKLEPMVSNKSASSICVDGAHSWACPLPRLSEHGSLVLSLPKLQAVTSIQLQGGSAPAGGAEGTLSASVSAQSLAAAAPAQQALTGADLLASLVLPCGLTLATVEPRHELTSAALADVFDWTALIKSNPPEKFLKRPPVRFLFDMVKFIGAGNPGFLDPELEQADWAVVGADKGSKLDFMDKMIQFITKAVYNSESVTTASAIVTGSDPELTNVLLQQLAIAIYAFQNRPETITPPTATATAAASRPLKSPAPKAVSHDAWVTVVRVEGSQDGQLWRSLCEVQTGLRAANQVVTIPLVAGSSKSNRYKFLRITPVKWNGEGKFGPAVRLNILGPEPLTDEEGEDDRVGPAVMTPLEGSTVSSVVEALLSALAVLIEAAEFVSRKEDAAKELKQLEVKKNLENLARDKQALETLLANEKKSLESNNQDLEQRLKACFKQLQETQGLLEKEQQMNAQLENHCREVETEKVAVQRALNEKNDEIAQLRAAMLALEANHEKERAQNEQLQEKLAESEKSVETLQDQLTQAEEARVASEHEREELLSQIAILTEERDGARVQEEELFEKLTERTNDLNQLRESYVEITDRWNDAQDENMDLRDKIESLQTALENRAFLHTASPAVSYQQPPLFAAPAATAASVVPSAAAVPKQEKESAVSPRGSKGTRAVPPAGDSRGAKGSPRGTSSGHHLVVSADSGVSAAMLAADTKAALPFSGASPPGRDTRSSTNNSSSNGSPRKPPPAPLAANSEYGDEYFDDYEEEFETDD